MGKAPKSEYVPNALTAKMHKCVKATLDLACEDGGTRPVAGYRVSPNFGVCSEDGPQWGIVILASGYQIGRDYALLRLAAEKARQLEAIKGVDWSKIKTPEEYTALPKFVYHACKKVLEKFRV